MTAKHALNHFLLTVGWHIQLWLNLAAFLENKQCNNHTNYNDHGDY